MNRFVSTCLLSAMCVSSFAADEAPPKPAVKEQAVQKQKARGFLGVAGSPFDGGFESTIKGYKIEEVWHGSSADQMGIRVGDIIVAINGSAVIDKASVTASLKGARIDDAVQVTLQRKGNEVNLAGVLKGIPNVDHAGSKGLPAQISKTRGVNENVLEDIAKLREDQHSLAQEIAILNQQLRELPKKIQTVSKEFKRVFPDGVFEIEIKINISSDATAKNPIQLGPHKSSPSPAEDTTKETEQAAPDNADESNTEADTIKPLPVQPDNEDAQVDNAEDVQDNTDTTTQQEK